MILDSSVIVAIVLGENDRLDYLARIHKARIVRISSASVLECYVVIYGKVLKGEFGHHIIDDLDAFLSDPKIEQIAVNADQVEIAKTAYWRFGRMARHPARLNFGDCFSYALAQFMNEPLLFKGEDFEQTDIGAIAIQP